MKQRIFCIIILLAVCFCCFCVSEDEALFEKYQDCKDDFQFEGLHLFYFDQDKKFTYTFFEEPDEEKLDIENNVQHSMALTCICRQTSDPIFFFSPSFVNDEDVYVYCVPGAQGSMSKYNSEAYDTLLFKYTQKIPNTLMNPFFNEKSNNDSVACFDIYGFPTKNVANQETCLLSAEKIDDNQVQVYSGPLISSVLSNLTNANAFYQWCYTNLKDTTEKLPGKCAMIMVKNDINNKTYPMFFCCYANESEKREIQAVLTQKEGNKKLFCAMFSENEISMQDYRNKYVSYACCTKVTWKYFWNGTSAEYYATNSNSQLSSEILINATSTGLCSDNNVKPEDMAIQQCCQDGHFCNLKLFSIRSNSKNHSRCHFKPDISLYFDESDLCEVYYDLYNNEQVYLHENISVRIIHEKKFSSTSYFPLHGEYSCSYAYAEIITFDSDLDSICEDKIGSVRSVFRCTCDRDNCDYIPHFKLLLEKKFSCQFLSSTKIIKDSIPPFTKLQQPDKWICYVEINKQYAESLAEVVAGHLDYTNDRLISKFKECLNKDFIDRNFCCVNVFDMDQEESNCTVEQQIQRFRANNKNPSGYDDGKYDPEITHCYSKDIEMLDASSESEHCPKSDGCFSTRILQTSEAASETEIEPAGCLGYAEDYTIDNLDLTSLSLGCRVKENWGRCSIVQSPSGEKRIVCCCNEPDENGVCNTKLTDVPEKIGKTFSSFKPNIP